MFYVVLPNTASVSDAYAAAPSAFRSAPQRGRWAS
jgi:hypothetical protein